MSKDKSVEVEYLGSDLNSFDDSGVISEEVEIGSIDGVSDDEDKPKQKHKRNLTQITIENIIVEESEESEESDVVSKDSDEELEELIQKEKKKPTTQFSAKKEEKKKEVTVEEIQE